MGCSTCGYQNQAGAMICGNCGAPLHNSIKSVATDEAPKKTMVKKLLAFLSKVETRHLEEQGKTQQLDKFEEAKAEPKSPPDISAFPPGTSILFKIDKFEILVEKPEIEVVLGRYGDMVSAPREVYPVDLSEHAGYALGVSRLHASLRPTDDWHLELMDLASSNGTYLNGYALNPYEIYHVYHGDEIRLGHMRMTVYFLLPED